MICLQGEPSGLAPMVSYMSKHEPGNLIFAYLLQRGYFLRLCRKISVVSQLKASLVHVFAHLFTNLRLPLSWNPEDKNSYPSTGESEVRWVDLCFLLCIINHFSYSKSTIMIMISRS